MYRYQLQINLFFSLSWNVAVKVIYDNEMVEIDSSTGSICSAEEPNWW